MISVSKVEEAFYDWWESPNEFNKIPDPKILEAFSAGYKSQEFCIKDLKAELIGIKRFFKEFIKKGFWTCPKCKELQITVPDWSYCIKCQKIIEEKLAAAMKKAYSPMLTKLMNQDSLFTRRSS